VTRGERPTELERVNLGPRAVPRQKIVNRVQDAQNSIIASLFLP
jgi:hypothetical protein